MSPCFATAVLSILVGAAVSETVPDPPARKLAVERIERLRGQVTYSEAEDWVGRLLGRRRRVVFVWLSRTKVTDDDLKCIHDLPSLERLWMRSCPRITDRGLEHLRRARKLWWLDFTDTAITDKGLEHLRGLTGMRILELSQTRVTDAGLVHLKGMKGLHTLFLIDTQVTDRGLEHLRALPNLKELWLFDTRVTAEGVKQLQTAMPELEIIYSLAPNHR